MPKYRVKWCETVEYYTDVWGSDEDKALESFRAYVAEHDRLPYKMQIEESGCRNFEMDTIKVETE